MKKSILFLASILLPALVFGLNGDGSAGNPYDGILTSNTTFGPGDVYIDGDIYTGAYALTIAPGTTLRIYTGVIIFIETNGSITADGTIAAPITFTANTDSWGHIYMFRALPSVFDHCTLEKGMPTLTQQGGNGGTIFANACASLQISNCNFRNNISAHLGGAIDVAGTPATVTGCIFENNHAGERGGAIEIGENTVITIDSCKIFSNSSVETSGAIHFGLSPIVTIQNTLIYNNLCLAANTGALTPGAATGYTGPVLVNIVNCVIANNMPGDLVLRTTATTSVKNTIIWGTGVSVRYIYEAPMTNNLINCAVKNAVAMNGSGIDIENTYAASFTLNSSNIASDGPNFKDPATGDYSIEFLSPCRDGGTAEGTPAPPATDFLENIRIGPYDIGAYEVQYSRWSGATDDSWLLADNWESGIIPDELTDNIIIPAAINYPECDNLAIYAPGSVTVEAGGALTVLGILTNGGSLTINSSGTETSGSLIVYGTSTGEITYNRFLRPEVNLGDRHFFSSPLRSQSVGDFFSANTPKIIQLWEWNELDGSWPVVSSSYGDFTAGKGYNIDQATGSDGLMTFTGSVVSATITDPLTLTVTAPYNSYADHYTDQRTPLGGQWGGGGWSLLGNPFTSAMNAGAFIDYNNGDPDDGSEEDNSFDPSYQALYVYDGVTNNYKYAAAAAPGQIYGGGFLGPYVQAGQGFFVLANYNDVDFTFLSSMQEHQPPVVMTKSAIAVDEPWPGLLLKVKYGDKESYTTIVYNSEMTAGLDPGFDIGQLSTGPDVEVYTSLAEKDNGVNFSRQALPITDCDKNVIQVGIDSEKGGEVIFSANTVPLGNYRFWLEDREAGIFTDLKTQSYSVTLPAKTYGTGRFFILASVNTPTVIRQPTAEENGVRIWLSNGKLIIKGEVSDKATCTVYNIQGQKVLEAPLADDELNTIALQAGILGVYVIRVTDGEKVTTRKVAVL